MVYAIFQGFDHPAWARASFNAESIAAGGLAAQFFSRDILLRENDYIARSCDLCGNREHLLLFVKEGYRHVRCANCGLVFVNPIWNKHLEGQTKAGTALMGEESLSKSQVRRIRNELRRIEHYRLNNTLLEIGPGRGWFAFHAKKAGWETWVVEVNVTAAAALRHLGLDMVIDTPLEEALLPSSFFDVVRLWDVVEHLESPYAVLKAVHSCLRPGGLLQLSTTNFASLSRWINGPDWVYLNGSDHIVLFEPATIAALLKKIGFHCIRIRTRSFNMRKKRYHPEQELPPPSYLLRPLRKIIDQIIWLTPYGHQMIVTALR